MASFGKKTPLHEFDERAWDIFMPRERYEQLMQWLRAQGPDEWHGCAASWNYGHGDAPLAWICSQPDCDAATAQDVFWKCNGAEHFEGGRILRSDDPKDFDGGFALARLIGKRWSEGGYSRHRLKLGKSAFEMVEDAYRRYLSYLESYGGRMPPWIAPVPTQPDDGYVIDEQFFSEGIPRTLARDVEESRRLYISSLSSIVAASLKWGWDLPPYRFGVKHGFINASDLPA